MMLGWRSVKLRNSQTSPVHSTAEEGKHRQQQEDSLHTFKTRCFLCRHMAPPAGLKRQPQPWEPRLDLLVQRSEDGLYLGKSQRWAGGFLITAAAAEINRDASSSSSVFI